MSDELHSITLYDTSTDWEEEKDFLPVRTADISNKDKILQAIDELRRRKARPDIDRICSLVFRRFGIVAKYTRMQLQQMVDSEIVVKVDYKGSTSYRNAAKWSKYGMYKNRAERAITGIAAIHSILSRAFGSLLVENPDYLDVGVPKVELERMMLEDDPLTDITEINLILTKAMKSRFLVELSNGNYSLADHTVPSSCYAKSSSIDECNALSVHPGTSQLKYKVSSNQKTKIPVKKRKPKIKPSDNRVLVATETSLSPPSPIASASATCSNTSSTLTSTKSGINSELIASLSTELGAIHVDGQRVGVRKKKVKKVFDPSDNYTPIRKRGRLPGTQNDSRKELKQFGSKCCLCNITNIQKAGKPEKLVQCRDCSNRAHMTCILKKTVNKKMHQNYNWVCSDCILCEACFEPRENETMVECNQCGHSYHVSCQTADVTEEKGNNWLCTSCRPRRRTTVNRSKPVAPKRIDKTFQSFIPKEKTPDVSNWTVDQVCKYLEDHGCSAQAAAFRYHEIDGKSLLMLKRHDVVYEMGLKAGPALKVYHFVQLLQVKDIKKVFPFNEMLR